VDVYSLHYNTERCIRQVQCGILTGNSIHDRLISVFDFATFNLSQERRLQKQLCDRIFDVEVHRERALFNLRGE
jgi:hypothetical protein